MFSRNEKAPHERGFEGLSSGYENAPTMRGAVGIVQRSSLVFLADIFAPETSVIAASHVELERNPIIRRTVLRSRW